MYQVRGRLKGGRMLTWGFKGESGQSNIQQRSERSEKSRDFGVNTS